VIVVLCTGNRVTRYTELHVVLLHVVVIQCKYLFYNLKYIVLTVLD